MKYKNVSTEGNHVIYKGSKKIVRPGLAKQFKMKGEFVTILPGEILDSPTDIEEEDMELVTEEKPKKKVVKKEPVVEVPKEEPKVKSSIKDKIVDIVEDALDDGKLNNSNKKEKKKADKPKKRNRFFR